MNDAPPQNPKDLFTEDDVDDDTTFNHGRQKHDSPAHRLALESLPYSNIMPITKQSSCLSI
jgi:hypothetical protein